jgi:hypothetical protein
MASTLTPLDQACLLVGRFALHFSAIESELNEAIRKLFELSPDSADTVCANIDFYKKLKIVNSALIDQDTEGNRRNSITALFNVSIRSGPRPAYSGGRGSNLAFAL